MLFFSFSYALPPRPGRTFNYKNTNRNAARIYFDFAAQHGCGINFSIVMYRTEKSKRFCLILLFFALNRHLTFFSTGRRQKFVEGMGRAAAFPSSNETINSGFPHSGLTD
jgi:hypothetical protein